MRLVSRIYDKAVFPAFFVPFFRPADLKGAFLPARLLSSLHRSSTPRREFLFNPRRNFPALFFQFAKEYEMSRYEEDDDIRTALLNMYGLGRQMTPRPKKEMTTRELLERQLAGYDDDMEPRTPMPDPELEFDGNELYV